MAEPIIKARDLGIKFARTRRRKLSVRELFITGGKKRPRGEFWPLRGISFDVRPGEAVGVVGRNGTGKSTLLKLIAGVLIPDEGTVSVEGKVAPLLELRAGFNEELTGRENVHLLASLHGMKSGEIEKRFDEIVEFAEVKDFIDMPLRHYSSGMKVRLGFAVIAQLSHPVLLVDEVLAVGDKQFKKKCYATIEKMLANGRTLLLVSHNERDLERFCTRGLYIREGKMVVDGTLAEAMAAYDKDTDDPPRKPAARKAGAKKPAAKKPAAAKEPAAETPSGEGKAASDGKAADGKATSDDKAAASDDKAAASDSKDAASDDKATAPDGKTAAPGGTDAAPGGKDSAADQDEVSSAGSAGKK